MKTHPLVVAAVAALLLVPVFATAADKVATQSASQGTHQHVRSKNHHRECALTTGTRIRPSRATHCAYTSKRATSSYSRESLENTGQFDTAGALRYLNPAY
jgi:hypothetical protein